jgi:ribosomal protein S18 acetylase RimI-like enzyme
MGVVVTTLITFAVTAAILSMAIPFCEALSAPTPSISSKLGELFGGGNNSNNNQNGVSIELFDPTNKASLQQLQDCRRSSFAATKQSWLDSERDFVDAKNVVEGRNLCAIAIERTTNTIVGSADLTPKKSGENVVTNVFVTPQERGRGIGRRLMVEGIEGVLASSLPLENREKESTNAVISLEVYTQNTPAIRLYQDLGYEPAGVANAGTLALANALGTNLFVKLSKTVSIQE